MSRQPAVSVLDQRRLSLRVSGRRIPAEGQAGLEELEALVGRVNEWWSSVTGEAEAIREQARREGFEEGRAEVLVQCAEQLAESQQAAHEFNRQSQARVVDLAIAIVRKVLPRLEQSELITALVEDAVASAHTNSYMLVHVHPEWRQLLEQRMAQWSRDHAVGPEPRILEDDGLDRLDVVVETDAGILRAGLGDRLGAVETGLRRAATTLEPQG